MLQIFFTWSCYKNIFTGIAETCLNHILKSHMTVKQCYKQAIILKDSNYLK